MGMLAWVMMGLAVWHFTVWLPDHALGGIVGAFVGAVVGAVLFGLAVNGFSVPGEHETTVITALEGIPGALLGIGAMVLAGRRSAPAKS